jgi:hypothetical protein
MFFILSLGLFQDISLVLSTSIINVIVRCTNIKVQNSRAQIDFDNNVQSNVVKVRSSLWSFAVLWTGPSNTSHG